jgi:molecular chaperone DnaK (HSP70)
VLTNSGEPLHSTGVDNLANSESRWLLSMRLLQVILYEMGSGSTQAALIKYSTYGRSKSSQTNQFEVLDVAYDHSLGSNSLDLLLLKHFADKFKAEGGADIR